LQRGQNGKKKLPEEKQVKFSDNVPRKKTVGNARFAFPTVLP